MRKIEKYTKNKKMSILDNNNLKLIDDIELNKINCKTKINIIDNLGYKYCLSLEEIKNNSRLVKFSKYNKFTIDNINNYIEINNIKVMFLSKKYEGNNKKYLFKCECGREYSCTWNDFYSKNRIKCDICSGGYKRKKKSINDVVLKAKKINLSLYNKDEEYINSKSKITWIDDNNYKYFLSLSDINELIKENNTSDMFSKYNPYTIDNIRNWLIINNYKNKLVSNKYIDSDTPLTFTCESCGEKYSVTFKHLKNENQIRCKKCSKNKSSYEYLVEKYLIENKINYETQYKINECADKRPLPFDFAIFNNDNLLFLLECDGKQHYSYTEFFGMNKENALENFEITKKHDNIKNKYCENNKIKLLRISYLEFKNKNYINILKNNLHI